MRTETGTKKAGITDAGLEVGVRHPAKFSICDRFPDKEIATEPAARRRTLNCLTQGGTGAEHFPALLINTLNSCDIIAPDPILDY